jgi:hypothetical protein
MWRNGNGGQWCVAPNESGHVTCFETEHRSLTAALDHARRLADPGDTIRIYDADPATGNGKPERTFREEVLKVQQ